MSFLLPLIKISAFQNIVPQELVIQLPEIVLSPEKVIKKTIWYQFVNYIEAFLVFGMFLFLGLFLIKLIKIINLMRKHQKVKKTNFTLVLIPKETTAFSFFNYVFLGENVPGTQREKIIAHELVHSNQKHSLDLLFFEILKIVMWFNPMIFIYQKRITLLHEYISDEIVSNNISKENYINNLLSSFFQVENIPFINQFYKPTFIKKRIIMMTKNKSKKVNQLKYLVLIPVLVGTLFYTACTSEKKSSKESPELHQLKKPYSHAVVLEVEEIVEEEIIEEEIIEEEISFMKIDKAPTFPGCKTGDKKCFSKMVQQHFVRNFDNEIPNNLGLDTGEKRIFIGFKIDKDGAIVNVKARAPHKDIEKEVLRVMSSLPKMIPGEHKEEKVIVKYTIPFILVVE